MDTIVTTHDLPKSEDACMHMGVQYMRTNERENDLLLLAISQFKLQCEQPSEHRDASHRRIGLVRFWLGHTVSYIGAEH